MAAVVLLAYAIWAVRYASVRSLADLARVGETFRTKSTVSAPIDALPPNPDEISGYDGQFFLFIALDPVGARHYVDEPSYRYSRIVYPLVARAVAFGQSGLVPFALLLVNLVAVGAGTLALAALLRSRGLSPWYASLFGFYPGLFVGVSHDLSEPLAYGLTAVGLWLYARAEHTPSGLLPAAAAFGVAGATRETTLLFPAAIALCLALRKDALPRPWRAGVTLVAVSVLPYAIVKGLIAAWLGGAGGAEATHFPLLPFAGLLAWWPYDRFTVEQVYGVVAPALAATVLAVVVVRRPTVGLLALVANVLVLVVFLPEPSYAEYRASGRITIGVVMAFLLCLPALLRSGRLAQAWIVLALWIAPWYDWLPTAFER